MVAELFAGDLFHLSNVLVDLTLDLFIDLRPEVLEEFKKACADNGTTPTTEIKKFIAAYCEAARDK